MNFNLKQLEAFISVADLGSFRKAAEHLNTTQPNISQRISSLESALKVSLMERDSSSVRLTSKGKELLLHARLVLTDTEKLIEASNNTALFDGTLRLGVTELVVHTWLREFLRKLKDVYPNLAVELTVDLSVNLKKELFARTIDLAFQSGPFNRQTSGSEDLGTYHWIWVASPALGIHHQAQVTLADLCQYQILTHAKDTQAFSDLESYFRTHASALPRLVPSNSLSLCLHMTQDGMGVATLPEAMVLEAIENGELVRIDYPWTPDALSFLARYDTTTSPLYIAKAAQLAAKVAGPYAD